MICPLCGLQLAKIIQISWYLSQSLVRQAG